MKNLLKWLNLPKLLFNAEKRDYPLAWAIISVGILTLVSFPFMAYKTFLIEREVDIVCGGSQFKFGKIKPYTGYNQNRYVVCIDYENDKLIVKRMP